MQGYYTQIITFTRVDDTVFPVRMRREWVLSNDGKSQSYELTECESVGWQQAHDRFKVTELDWDSNRMRAETRAELLASGVIRLPGDGQPYLSL